MEGNTVLGFLYIEAYGSTDYIGCAGRRAWRMKIPRRSHWASWWGPRRREFSIGPSFPNILIIRLSKDSKKLFSLVQFSWVPESLGSLKVTLFKSRRLFKSFGWNSPTWISASLHPEGMGGYWKRGVKTVHSVSIEFWIVKLECLLAAHS